MTDVQKKDVERLRKLGYGYKTIAKQLLVPVETIKSHCRRHDIQKEPEKALYVQCLNCGKTLNQLPGRKRKKYCSDACRASWWAMQPENVRYKTRYKHVCEMCGTVFESHTKHQRFCSQKCAAAERRGEKAVYGPAKESQYATEADCSAGKAWAEGATADRPVTGTDSCRAGLPGVPPYCKCPECRWFVDGKKYCQSYIIPAEAVQAPDSGTELSPEKE